MRAEPGSQQRPDAFDRVDRHIRLSIAVIVASMLVLDELPNERLDSGLLDVGQCSQDRR